MKNLIYCTGGYPGDLYSEKVFVDAELEALRRRFHKIIIVPVDKVSRSLRFMDMLPEGVTGDFSLAEDKTVHSRIRRLRYLFNPFTIRSLSTIRDEARGIKQWLKGLYQALTAIAISKRLSKIAQKNGFTPDNTILYSLWFHDSAAAQALMAENEGWKMATRAHTSDLYDERMLFRSKKVRSRLLHSVGKVFSISRRGKEYLDSRFPDFKDKFEWLPLGSIRLFPPAAVPEDKQAAAVATAAAAGRKASLREQDEKERLNPIEFVTVARLDPIKRLDLIEDVLEELARKNPDRRLRWTVIGDGPCLEQLNTKRMLLDIPNLDIVTAGRMTNREIQKLYSERKADWFIMMSYSEGIPISMGEAMSYGIPVITTDVGEIRELADEDCAIFLPRDVNVEEAARILNGRVFDSTLRKDMGEKAMRKWEKTFDSALYSERLASTLASFLKE